MSQPQGDAFRLYTTIGYDPHDIVWIGQYGPATDEAWMEQPVKLSQVDQLIHELTLTGQNVYIMVNRSSNKTGNRRGTVNNITQLNALYADLDIKEGGLSSEQACMKVIQKLSEVLESPPALIVYSGNGMQPYWPLDYEEINAQNFDQVTTALAQFGNLVQLFANEVGGIVDNVYDLPRVLRAPGSINYKDPDNPKPVKVSFNDQYQILSLDAVSYTMNELGIRGEAARNITIPVLPMQGWGRDGELDCGYSGPTLARILMNTPTARHPWLIGSLITAYSMYRNGCIDKDQFVAYSHAIEARFRQLLQNVLPTRPFAAHEVESGHAYARAFVESLQDYEVSEQLHHHAHVQNLNGITRVVTPTAAPKEIAQAEGRHLEDKIDVQAPLYATTHPETSSAVAYSMYERMRPKFRHAPSTDVWFHWTGSIWEEDKEEHYKKASQQATEYHVQIMAERGKTNNIPKMLSQSTVRNGRESLQEWGFLALETDALNAVTTDLATPGGVVDLTTGVLREADPRWDWNTQTTKVAPKMMPTPKWDTFLDTVVPNKEVQTYLQTLVGASLIGKQVLHKVPILSGSGANGKSVFLNTIGEIFGSYAKKMPESFMVQRRNEEHSTEVADLFGVRLAVINEVPPTARFNEERLKSLTGGDKIRARYMHKNHFEFDPSHMFFIAVNHLPSVQSGGDGFWRRIEVIEFNVRIPEEDQNMNLTEELIREEGPGILAWAIEGAKRILTGDKIHTPHEVRMATDAYRTAEDHVTTFVAEKLVITGDPAHRMAPDQLRRLFSAWCRQSALDPMPGEQFMRELRSRLPQVEPPSYQPRRLIYGVREYRDYDDQSGFIPATPNYTMNPDDYEEK